MSHIPLHVIMRSPFLDSRRPLLRVYPIKLKLWVS